MVTATTPDVQALVTTISTSYPALRNVGAPGRNFADPIVVALAEHLDYSVVTHELATGNLNGPRIPDVCRDRGITVMQVHHMVRELGWTFS